MDDRERPVLSRREEKARAIVREKMKFIKHAVTYVIIIGFLYVVNKVTYSGYQWWIWPALGWGIGLTSHFFRAFIFSGSSLEERMVQRGMDKLDNLE